MKRTLELPRVNEGYSNNRLSLHNYKSVFIPFTIFNKNLTEKIVLRFFLNVYIYILKKIK